MGRPATRLALAVVTGLAAAVMLMPAEPVAAGLLAAGQHQPAAHVSQAHSAHRTHHHRHLDRP
jgi:membrane protein YqaA with SNARE-associated domain